MEDSLASTARSLNVSVDLLRQWLGDLGHAVMSLLQGGHDVVVPNLAKISAAQNCTGGGCGGYYSSGGPIIEPAVDVTLELKRHWRCKEEVATQRVVAMALLLKALLEQNGSVNLEGFGTLRRSTVTLIDYEPSAGTPKEGKDKRDDPPRSVKVALL